MLKYIVKSVTFGSACLDLMAPGMQSASRQKSEPVSNRKWKRLDQIVGWTSIYRALIFCWKQPTRSYVCFRIKSKSNSFYCLQLDMLVSNKNVINYYFIATTNMKTSTRKNSINKSFSCTHLILMTFGFHTNNSL